MSARGANRSRRGLRAALAALLVAWAAVPARAAEARDCAALLERQQSVNVGAGVYSERAVVAVPVIIDIPLTLDPERYGACLKRAHPERSGAIRAWVEHATACRRASRVRVRLGQAATAARIGSDLDTEAYRACLAGGPAVEVELGP